MTTIEPIKITGLAEFRRDLKTIDRELPRLLRVTGNEAAQLVVDYARGHVPQGRTGRARRSVRATSTQSSVRVSGGGARVPYYPWLDFGGKVGRRKSVRRPFIPTGRYIYPGYTVNRDEIEQRLVDGLVALAERAGVAVDGG